MNELLICHINDHLLDNRRKLKHPMTVRSLEKVVGLSHQGLLNLRDGVAEPKLGTAARIAHALGTSIEKLWPLGQFRDPE